MKTNYYLDTEPDWVVAFLDILGFSNLIRKNDTVSINDEGYMTNVKVVFNNILSWFDETRQKELEIKFKFVSDSIFIASRIENIEALLDLIDYVVFELFNLMHVCVRGGIAVGSLHFDENLWGTAVVEAVALESDASEPRIFIRKEDYQRIVQKRDLKQYFCKSKNDKYYYDYFQHYITDMDNKSNQCTTLANTAWVIKEQFYQSEKDEFRKKWHSVACDLYCIIQRNREYINSCNDFNEKLYSTQVDLSQCFSNYDVLEALLTDCI